MLNKGDVERPGAEPFVISLLLYLLLSAFWIYYILIDWHSLPL